MRKPVSDRDAPVWILPGDAPTLAGLESPFYDGGPVWRVDPAAALQDGTFIKRRYLVQTTALGSVGRAGLPVVFVA